MKLFPETIERLVYSLEDFNTEFSYDTVSEMETGYQNFEEDSRIMRESMIAIESLETLTETIMGLDNDSYSRIGTALESSVFPITSTLGYKGNLFPSLEADESDAKSSGEKLKAFVEKAKTTLIEFFKKVWKVIQETFTMWFDRSEKQIKLVAQLREKLRSAEVRENAELSEDKLIDRFAILSMKTKEYLAKSKNGSPMDGDIKAEYVITTLKRGKRIQGFSRDAIKMTIDVNSRLLKTKGNKDFSEVYLKFSEGMKKLAEDSGFLYSQDPSVKEYEEKNRGASSLYYSYGPFFNQKIFRMRTLDNVSPELINDFAKLSSIVKNGISFEIQQHSDDKQLKSVVKKRYSGSKGELETILNLIEETAKANRDLKDAVNKFTGFKKQIESLKAEDDTDKLILQWTQGAISNYNAVLRGFPLLTIQANNAALKYVDMCLNVKTEDKAKESKEEVKEDSSKETEKE